MIFPFLAEVSQIDPTRTDKDPDAGGPLARGYDPDFREPATFTDAAGSRQIATKRVSKCVPCQVEVEEFESLQRTHQGDAPTSLIRLVFHFSDLEKSGLVSPDTGEGEIRPTDQLLSLRRRCFPDKVVQRFRDNPGLFAVESLPRSFGLGQQRNLLVVRFEERRRGVQRVG